MADSNDFTFCQVSSESIDGSLGTPKRFPNLERIALDDSHVDSGSTKTVDATEGDRLSDVTNSKDCMSSTSLSKSNEISSTPPRFNGTTPAMKGDSGDSFSGSQDKRSANKRPVARAKVPFEKGYSQMDWLKLTTTHPDLAGLKGQPRRVISMDEVRMHKSEGSIWTVLKGRVYSISPYMNFHPGGVDMLMKAAGKDCTALFNKYHAWVNAEFLLEKCLVGVLEDSS